MLPSSVGPGLPPTTMRLLLVLFTAAAARPRWHELSEEYAFEQYKADFGKSYAPQEDDERRVIFEARLKSILDQRYDAEFRRLVVPGASAFESCKRAPRPNHVVHNVPWMNMNRPGAAGSFYSEYAFSYHVVAKGARCTPLGVPGPFCLEKSATGGRAQCRDSNKFR